MNIVDIDCILWWLGEEMSVRAQTRRSYNLGKAQKVI